MSMPSVVARVRLSPESYFSPVGFDSAAAFILGLELGAGTPPLEGFREWIILRLGRRSSLTWVRIAREILAKENPQALEAGRVGADCLFGLFEEFFKAKDEPNGLRKIFLEYEIFLREYDGYTPDSPVYVSVSKTIRADDDKPRQEPG